MKNTPDKSNESNLPQPVAGKTRAFFLLTRHFPGRRRSIPREPRGASDAWGLLWFGVLAAIILVLVYRFLLHPR